MLQVQKECTALSGGESVAHFLVLVQFECRQLFDHTGNRDDRLKFDVHVEQAGNGIECGNIPLIVQAVARTVTDNIFAYELINDFLGQPRT